MSNIRDVEDAYLTAKEDYDRWYEQFLSEYFAPYFTTQLAMVRGTLPALSEEQEKALDELVKRMAGGL